MPFSRYLPEHMGSATLSPSGPFVAGTHAEFTLVYTAGTFGIDDTGMLKISWRTTSDMAKPQFTDPAAANYTSVVASNGAKLEYWIERLNIRPWVNTLLIRVGRGFLRAGDTITVRFGDRRGGSPGLRLQTNCEEHFCAEGLRRCVRDLRVHRASRLAGLRAGGRRSRAVQGDPALARGCGRAVPARDRRRGYLGQSDRDRQNAHACFVGSR